MATRSTPILLREAAAMYWSLPLVDAPPTVVDVLAVDRGSSRARNGVAEHHHNRAPQLTELDGVQVSSLAQTVVDLSRFASFRRAVTATDHALRMRDQHGDPVVTRDELLEMHAALPDRARGSRQCAAVIEFADPLSESPLESISRLGIRGAHLPPPILQHRIRLPSGSDACVDFFWPALGVVGEADGRNKYSDPAFLRGRTPEQAVYDEKVREDAIRAVTRGFARWGWDDAFAVAPMVAKLAAAGVHPT